MTKEEKLAAILEALEQPTFPEDILDIIYYLSQN